MSNERIVVDVEFLRPMMRKLVFGNFSIKNKVKANLTVNHFDYRKYEYLIYCLQMQSPPKYYLGICIGY